MFTKNNLKYYTSLLQKKYRRQESKFIIEGKLLVDEGLKSKFECEILLMTKSFVDKNKYFLSQAKKHNTRTELLKEYELKKISGTEHPQGIVAVFKKKFQEFGDISTDNLIVGLENISDPGNLGTIFRNCDWFGLKSVLLSPDCAEIYNPKTVRASMGSIFHLKIFAEIDFYKELEKLKKQGYKILCSHMQGKDIFKFKRPVPSIVIFCNEANGPSQKLLSITDYQINIPRLGQAESLNVASASAIILAELKKPS